MIRHFIKANVNCSCNDTISASVSVQFPPYTRFVPDSKLIVRFPSLLKSVKWRVDSSLIPLDNYTSIAEPITKKSVAKDVLSYGWQQSISSTNKSYLLGGNSPAKVVLRLTPTDLASERFAIEESGYDIAYFGTIMPSLVSILTEKDKPTQNASSMEIQVELAASPVSFKIDAQRTSSVKELLVSIQALILGTVLGTGRLLYRSTLSIAEWIRNRKAKRKEHLSESETKSLLESAVDDNDDYDE